MTLTQLIELKKYIFTLWVFSEVKHMFGQATLDIIQADEHRPYIASSVSSVFRQDSSFMFTIAILCAVLLHSIRTISLQMRRTNSQQQLQ